MWIDNPIAQNEPIQTLTINGHANNKKKGLTLTLHTLWYEASFQSC